MNKTYTNQELREFEKELKPFRVKKTLRDGYKAEYTDFEAYLVHKRVLVIPHGYKSGSVVESRIHEYQELNDKYEQLKKLKRKTEFAKAKEVEQLEETGATIG